MRILPLLGGVVKDVASHVRRLSHEHRPDRHAHPPAWEQPCRVRVRAARLDPHAVRHLLDVDQDRVTVAQQHLLHARRVTLESLSPMICGREPGRAGGCGEQLEGRVVAQVPQHVACVHRLAVTREDVVQVHCKLDARVIEQRARLALVILTRLVINDTRLRFTKAKSSHVAHTLRV